MAPQHRLEGETDRPGPGVAWLDVGSEVETSTHTAGIGWRITTDAGARPVRAVDRRRVSSRLAAELDAVRRGLTDLARGPRVAVVVRASDPTLVALFGAPPPARFARALRAADRLRSTFGRFSTIGFELRPGLDRELRHAIGDALDVGLHRAAAVEEQRERAIERILDRARSVSLERREDGWVAQGRYRVSLDPPACECPAWTARWARVPIAGRRAQRLPCKHLVALAVRLGISVPVELASLGRRADGPERITRP